MEEKFQVMEEKYYLTLLWKENSDQFSIFTSFFCFLYFAKLFSLR